ncbi:HDOD domain-containing protein [Quadrisphaera setariae]|uniref:HDOD domain-containing protein n=1 Tax=Quadrisphaera setariae TaxID=2593304 RepID=A0A5C8ZD86_9ACTN|nr:HDOD domain-containing protein [Quadrisphaera setariae]TXR55108.1 HDOD domain-containing protein [Quadrisphaera setariae]
MTDPLDDAPDGAGDDAQQRADAALAALVDVVDELASRRPVAARIVTMTGDSSVGSPELAAVLSGDVALTARVTRLANSVFYGLSGRVRTVPFAVTVVGFAAVRAMAATAAVGTDSEGLLPEDTWARSEAVAVASGELAPLFGVPAPEAFCLGLLAGLGQAVLAHADTTGYRALLEDDDVRRGGRQALLAAERTAFGVCHTEVSAAALSAWHFPDELAEALHLVDAAGRTTPWSRCLATALEAVERAAAPSAPPRDPWLLSSGRVSEERLRALSARLTVSAPPSSSS